MAPFQLSLKNNRVHRPAAGGQAAPGRAGLPSRRQVPPAPRAVQPDKRPGEAKRREGIRIDHFEPSGTDADPSSRGSPTTPSPFEALLSTVDFSEPMSFDGEEKTEYDPLRDGPLRYLGYANELGEAFAAWLFAGGVPLSYAIAIGYVLFDTADKYRRTMADARAKLDSRALAAAGVDAERLISVIGLERGVDTLVWQLIASVAAPGYTIHTVVAIVSALLLRVEEVPAVVGALHAAADWLGLPHDVLLGTFNKSVPTASGLLAIPAIVHPLDAGVHALLNVALRPALRRYICTAAGGRQAGLAICRDCE